MWVAHAADPAVVSETVQACERVDERCVSRAHVPRTLSPPTVHSMWSAESCAERRSTLPTMSQLLNETFARKNEKNQAVFVTFVTAGFPGKEDTPDILLALEQGGADVIEVGVPFSDPQADGPAIQDSNKIALANGVGYAQCLAYVREARARAQGARDLHGLLQPHHGVRRGACCA